MYLQSDMDLFGNHQASQTRIWWKRRGLSNISPDLSVFLFMLKIVEFHRMVCILPCLICLSLPLYFQLKLQVILAQATCDLRQIRSSSRYMRGEGTYLCLQLNIKHLLFSVHINVWSNTDQQIFCCWHSLKAPRTVNTWDFSRYLGASVSLSLFTTQAALVWEVLSARCLSLVKSESYKIMERSMKLEV